MVGPGDETSPSIPDVKLRCSTAYICQGESIFMSSPPEDDSATGTADPEVSQTAQPPAVPQTCANCGRTFIGEYCPGCGQRAESELSILHILGGFVRELVDTERGLWRTFRDLTLRPGTAARGYLAGARQPFTSPGRYLLVGAIVTTVTSAALQRLGAPRPQHWTIRCTRRTGLYEGRGRGFRGSSGRISRRNRVGRGRSGSRAARRVSCSGARADRGARWAPLLGFVSPRHERSGRSLRRRDVRHRPRGHPLPVCRLHPRTLRAPRSARDSTLDCVRLGIPGASLRLPGCSYVWMLWGKHVERNQGRPRIGMGIH